MNPKMDPPGFMGSLVATSRLDRCATLLLFLDRLRFTLPPPGETESGSAGTQPDRGIAWPRVRRWAAWRSRQGNTSRDQLSLSGSLPRFPAFGDCAAKRIVTLSDPSAPR